MKKQDIYVFIVVCLLSLVTILTFHFMEEYHIRGNNLIINGQFEQDVNHWLINDSSEKKSSSQVFSGYLLVTAQDSVTISQDFMVPDKEQFIKVSAYAAIMNVFTGKESWQKARVYFANQVDGQFIWTQKHHLFSLDGAKSWHLYEEVFHIHPLADKLHIAIQLPESGGVIAIDDLSAFVAEKNSNFQYVSYVLMLLWFLLAVWIVISYLTQKHFYLLLAASLLVLLLILVPQEIKQLIIDSFKTLLFIDDKSHSLQLDINPVNLIESSNKHYRQSSIIFNFSTLGHFFIFFLYTFLLAFIQKKLDLRIIIFLLSFAMVTEVLQLFTTDRQANIVDFSVNSAGVFIAVIIIKLIFSAVDKTPVEH